MQCWEGQTVGRQEVSLWRGHPFGKMSLWKASKDSNHEFLSASVTWSVPPAQCCGRTDIPEMSGFSNSVGPFFSSQHTPLGVSFLFFFFPGSVLIIAAAIIFHVFLTCSMCHVLDTTLLHAVLWAGSSMATLSDQWRASPIPNGFWPSSSQSVTDVCGHVAGS